MDLRALKRGPNFAWFTRTEDPTLLLFLRQVRAITVERLGDVLTYALHGPPEGFVTIGVTTRGVNHSESEHKYFVAKATHGQPLV